MFSKAKMSLCHSSNNSKGYSFKQGISLPHAFPFTFFLLVDVQKKSRVYHQISNGSKGLCPHGIFMLYSETSLLSETTPHSPAGQIVTFFNFPSARFTIAVYYVCDLSVQPTLKCFHLPLLPLALQKGEICWGICLVFTAALPCQWKVIMLCLSVSLASPWFFYFSPKCFIFYLIICRGNVSQDSLVLPDSMDLCQFCHFSIFILASLSFFLSHF